MKIIATQENLNKGIKTVERLVGKNTTLPILSNILLETKGSRLKISATNLELGITTWVRVKVEEEGKVTVPAQIISNFVSNLPSEKIILTSDKKQNIHLKCDQHKVNIKGLSAKDFPIIPQIKKDPLVELPIPAFWRGLSQVSPAMSQSQSRPEISGLFVKTLKDKAKLVATDSYRLAEKSIEVEKINQKNQSFIVPQQTVKELVRLLHEQEGVVKISLEENQALFKMPQINLISRLIEGQFPDYEQIIPDDLSTQVILETEEIKNAVQLAALFSSEDNEVKFGFKKQKGKGGVLKVESESEEVGGGVSKIKTEIQGQGCQISFNHQYIQDGLKQILSDRVSFQVQDKQTPGLLKPYTPEDKRPKDKGYLYLIMPIKS